MTLNKLVSLVFLLLICGSSLLGQSKDPQVLFPVCAGGRCGYMDRTGKIAIPLKFDEAFDFSDGLAQVIQGDKIGFIDTTGRVVIAPRFVMAREFSEGMAWVRPFSEEFGYIDTSGKMIVKAKFQKAENFRSGLARVALPGKKLVDPHGTE